MNLTDTQVAMIEQWCKGQVGDEALESHVNEFTVERWKTLRDELSPSDLENACERFIQMQQARRMTVQVDGDGEEDLFR